MHIHICNEAFRYTYTGKILIDQEAVGNQTRYYNCKPYIIWRHGVGSTRNEPSPPKVRDTAPRQQQIDTWYNDVFPAETFLFRKSTSFWLWRTAHSVHTVYSVMCVCMCVCGNARLVLGKNEIGAKVKSRPKWANQVFNPLTNLLTCNKKKKKVFTCENATLRLSLSTTHTHTFTN